MLAESAAAVQVRAWLTAPWHRVREQPSHSNVYDIRMLYIIRVRVERMGSQKCRIVGKSQLLVVLIVIYPIISTRTRTVPNLIIMTHSCCWDLPVSLTDRHKHRGGRTRISALRQPVPGKVCSSCTRSTPPPRLPASRPPARLPAHIWSLRVCLVVCLLPVAPAPCPEVVSVSASQNTGNSQSIQGVLVVIFM
eukprot:SAG25_NODE_283_length_10420_cov_9.898382_5_plen_193_part_00